MALDIYATRPREKSEIFAINNVTVALSRDNKFLNKTVYASGQEIAYGNAYYFQFFNKEVECLGDLFELVKLLLFKPYCCILRGVAKDTVGKQRRLLHDKDGVSATIIEQPQNWIALDVDGYGNSSGDLKEDAKKVLLALGLDGVEAFAIPSAGYMRKPGIRIRIFLWNSMKVSCLALKKYFEHYKNVVDLALFHPIQPIYIARPNFIGMSDPCNKLWTWVAGASQFVDIVDRYRIVDDKSEKLHTKKQARLYLDSFIKGMADIESGHRHDYLTGKGDSKAVLIGKCIAQELLDEGETREEILMAAKMFWHGDARKDADAINWIFKRGYQSMEGNDD